MVQTGKWSRALSSFEPILCLPNIFRRPMACKKIKPRNSFPDRRLKLKEEKKRLENSQADKKGKSDKEEEQKKIIEKRQWEQRDTGFEMAWCSLEYNEPLVSLWCKLDVLETRGRAIAIRGNRTFCQQNGDIERFHVKITNLPSPESLSREDGEGDPANV